MINLPLGLSIYATAIHATNATCIKQPLFVTLIHPDLNYLGDQNG